MQQGLGDATARRRSLSPFTFFRRSLGGQHCLALDADKGERCIRANSLKASDAVPLPTGGRRESPALAQQCTVTPYSVDARRSASVRRRLSRIFPFSHLGETITSGAVSRDAMSEKAVPISFFPVPL